MKLSGRRLLQAFYWRLRRNRADAVHMLSVLPSFAALALRLPARLRKGRPRGGRQVMAIVLLERMGDIVAAEPLARLARRTFPDAWICWIVQAPYVALPKHYPEIDDTIVVRCLTEWMLVERLRLFDVVWNLHIDGTDCPHCCIPRHDGVVPTRRDYFHHGGLLAVQCLSAGLPVLDESPVLAPPAAATVAALALPSRFIAIHGASTDPGREWTVAKWRALIARLLAETPMSIVEIGTRPMAVAADAGRQRAVCGLSMPETAEVIRRAALYVGIDSGPAHMAHAVATPGVILLGRYANFARYMPFSGSYADGSGATLLHANGPAATLTVDEVFAAVAARLRDKPRHAHR